MGGENKNKNYALLHARLGADADLEEVPDGVHGLYEPRLRRLVCPKIRLRVRLREHPRRADEVPRCKSEARVPVVLLGGDVLQHHTKKGGGVRGGREGGSDQTARAVRKQARNTRT